MKILVDLARLNTVRDNLYHINDLSLLEHRPCEKKLIETTINIISGMIDSPEPSLDERPVTTKRKPYQNDNRQVILEILDMLAEYAYDKKKNSRTILGDKVSDLVIKLVGEK